MTEESPTPEPAITPLGYARNHVRQGETLLADFETRPADHRQVSMAAAHFGAASAIASIETARALSSIADAVARRIEG